MADTDNAITGKDVTVTLTYNGLPVAVVEKTEVSVRKLITEITTKPLGETVTRMNTEFEGWEIQLRLDTSRKEASEFVDLITAGELLRVPSLVGLTITKRYRNFEQKGHRYVDLVLTDYREQHRRDESSTEEMTLKTGLNRVAIG
ncbi:MAG: hypothetical protein AAFV53_32150 [Myxococcota bacterium]